LPNLLQLLPLRFWIKSGNAGIRRKNAVSFEAVLSYYMVDFQSQTPECSTSGSRPSAQKSPWAEWILDPRGWFASYAKMGRAIHLLYAKVRFLF
jgi:hypothetical protein